jgi:tape measure domain-containing protein
MADSQILEWALRVDTKEGTAELKQVSNYFDKVGQEGERAGKRGGKGLDSLFGKTIKLNQALELAKKAFNLLRTPVEALINTGAKFETLRLQLDTVLQSAEKGKEYFQWIKEFSASTPFQIEGLTESVLLLESFGINARSSLKTIGDASAALNTDMKELSRVLGQVYAKPNASMEEMLQLIERGVPVFKILQEQLGLTAAQVGDIGRQGIAGKKVYEALLKGMDQYYGGAMQKMSKTWTGMWSTLKDKFSLFLGQVAGPVLEKLKGKLDSLLQKIDKWAQDGTLEKWAHDIAGFVSDAINALAEIGTFIWEWKDELIFIAKQLVVIFAAKKLNIFGKGLAGVLDKFGGFVKELKNAPTYFKVLRAEGNSVFKSLKGSIGGLGGKIGGLKGALGNLGPIAAAAFVGWEIGSAINDVLGLPSSNGSTSQGRNEASLSEVRKEGRRYGICPKYAKGPVIGY